MCFEKFLHKKIYQYQYFIRNGTSHSLRLRNSLHINRLQNCSSSFKQRFKPIEKGTAAQTHHQVKSFRACTAFCPSVFFLFLFFFFSKSRLHASMRSNTLNGDQTVVRASRKVNPDIYEPERKRFSSFTITVIIVIVTRIETLD